MEPMKQCPNCGKYVAADKTYCMSCGTTLGVKCPSCGKVLPLMSKTCPCGHSFVKKTRKKNPSRVLPFVKKYAQWLLLAILAAVLVATIVFAALPALSHTVTDLTGREPQTTEYTASGFSLIGYFLGGHPQGVTGVLDAAAFEELTTPLTLLLYAEGLGWLILLVALVLSALLGGVNCRRLSAVTSKRLLLPHGIALGGSTVVFGTDLAIRWLMETAAENAYAFSEGSDGVATHAWQVGSAFPILVFVLGVLLFGAHMTLHLLSLKNKKNEGTGEIPLWTILKTPFVLLGRLVRRAFKKRRKGQRDDDERTVTCTKRFTLYLILLGVSLVFTQALLSKISHLFFWFMLLLPLPMLLYALVARRALTVTMHSESATTEKNAPYTYEFDIENHSPLAFPFIDARLSIPQANSVRCTERSVRLAMAPLSTYHMKNTVRFRFRGTYDIGVKYFDVYDFFRMFRVRVPVSYLTSVYVLPRRLTMDDLLAQSVADSTLRTVSSPLVFDRLEVSDIRDYRMGDSLKSIHWKLSSKSEDFIVKEHNTGTSDKTVIFCDMAAHYPDEPPVDKTLTTHEPPLTPEEKKKRRKTEKTAKKEAKKTAKTAKAGKKLSRGKSEADGTDDVHATLGEASETTQRKPQGETPPADMPAKESATVDIHRLADAAYYEDMNEYLADGVVELTIASVLAELHMGHEVTLAWYDRRAENGVFLYPIKGVEAFEQIYHLFATAPLTAREHHVTNLTATVTDVQSAKQMFVVSAMDSEMLSKMSDLPCVSDAGSFGSAEVILYDPDDRFMYPQGRDAYLEGCRQQLLEVGLTLRVSGMIAVRGESASADISSTDQGKEEQA